jgi:hypothetical protein
MATSMRSGLLAVLTVVGVVSAACSGPASPVAPGDPAATASAGPAPAAGAATTSAPQSAASAQKITLCHVQGNGGYVEIAVSAAAEPAHRRHGDAAIGEPVPGSSSLEFGPGCVPVAVAVLIDVTAGFTGTSNNFVGQSFTTPPGGPYGSLRFNWYTFSGMPTSFGTLYLLSAEYLGLPTGLNASTPGFIAMSSGIVAGQYRFPAEVTIAGGTQYWVYTDSMGAFVTSFSGSTYPGGDMYVTGLPHLAFHLAPASSPSPPPPPGFIDANFRLQGAAAVP